MRDLRIVVYASAETEPFLCKELNIFFKSDRNHKYDLSRRQLRIIVQREFTTLGLFTSALVDLDCI